MSPFSWLTAPAHETHRVTTTALDQVAQALAAEDVAQMAAAVKRAAAGNGGV